MVSTYVGGLCNSPKLVVACNWYVVAETWEVAGDVLDTGRWTAYNWRQGGCLEVAGVAAGDPHGDCFEMAEAYVRTHLGLPGRVLKTGR